MIKTYLHYTILHLLPSVHFNHSLVLFFHFIYEEIGPEKWSKSIRVKQHKGFLTSRILVIKKSNIAGTTHLSPSQPMSHCYSESGIFLFHLLYFYYINIYKQNIILFSMFLTINIGILSVALVLSTCFRFYPCWYM